MLADNKPKRGKKFAGSAVQAAADAVAKAAKPKAGPPAPKPKKAKPTRAPVSDVRSSGKGYGIPKAKRAQKKQLVEAIRKSEPRKPLQAKTKSAGTSGLAAVTAAGDIASKVNPIVAAATVANAATGGKGVTGRVAKDVLKATHNIPKDVAELAVTTPSSLYKLGDTLAHGHVGEAGKMLVQPYGDLLKHPEKFVTERPATTALMVQPVVKGPGRVAGKVLRKAGKQTLERDPAVLPGTALKEVRVKSRDAMVNRRQTKADAKRTGPVEVTKKQVDKRVDQFHDASRGHTKRAADAAARAAKERGMTAEQAAEHVSGAVGGAKHEINRRFVREFGSTWEVDAKTGSIMKPKNATEGALHDTRAAAEKVAEKLAPKVPYKPVVFKAGEQYGVVPDYAAQRLGHHGRVGNSPAVGAVALRESRKAFGKTVLPFSKNFLAGQPAEAALRSVVERAGPVSYVRAKRVLNHLKETDQEAYRALVDRTIGEKGTTTGHSAHATEYMNSGATLRDSMAKTDVDALKAFGENATKAGEAFGVRHVRKAYGKYTDLVFNKYNASIERVAKTAMTGRAIKDLQLDNRLVGLSEQAIEDAANGLKATHAQARLSRELDRMYGKYTGFAPSTREALMHTTPFLPWYINTARFVLKTLPVDHPTHAALLASLDKATEEWRKSKGLSFHGDAQVPDFMFGGPLGRWLPFAPKDVSGAVGGLLAPQIIPTVINLAPGVDWKGDKVKGSKSANAALTLVESLVPGVSQVDRALGLGDRHVRHKKGAESVLTGKSLRDVKRDTIKQVDITAGFRDKHQPARRKKAKSDLPKLPELDALPPLPELPPLEGR